jgi:UDP-N-acetyl-2-amino-2-deoxyglucuronate dehydrogenase
VTTGVRIGLIGAGNISRTHAKAASSIPGASVVAVIAPTSDHATQLANEYGAAAYSDLPSFLAHRPMDMVAVGSPSGLHAEHGIAVARHGLHVLVEKPIDVSTVRADALIAEAERAGVTLGVIFQDRLKPDVSRLKAIVDGGAIGKPILADARVKWYRSPAYYRESLWRGTQALDGGGALMNQAVHTVDLLLWLFGPVRRVFGKTATRLHDIESEDTAVAVLEFENGALGTLEAATSAYPGYSRRLGLTGSEGTVILDGDRLIAVDLRSAADVLPQRTQSACGPRGSGAPRAVIKVGAATPSESASSPVVSDVTAHRDVFEDFIRAWKTGTKPCCDGHEARRSVELIEAVYRASRTNEPVDIPRPS